MTIDELDEFLGAHSYIEWDADDESRHFMFRNTLLPWYKDEEHHTRVEGWKLEKMDENELLSAINRGLDVDHITRITGYMTRVSGWNKGKLGELKDRYRNEGMF